MAYARRSPSPNTVVHRSRDYPHHRFSLMMNMPAKGASKKGVGFASLVVWRGAVRGKLPPGEIWNSRASPRPGITSPLGKWICRCTGPTPARSHQPADPGALGSLGPTCLAKPTAAPWLRRVSLFNSFQNRMEPASIFGGKRSVGLELAFVGHDALCFSGLEKPPRGPAWRFRQERCS